MQFIYNSLCIDICSQQDRGELKEKFFWKESLKNRFVYNVLFSVPNLDSLAVYSEIRRK